MILPNDKLSFLQKFMVILIVDVMLKKCIKCSKTMYIAIDGHHFLCVIWSSVCLTCYVQRFTKLTCVFNQEILTLYSPQMNLKPKKTHCYFCPVFFSLVFTCKRFQSAQTILYTGNYSLLFYFCPFRPRWQRANLGMREF